LGLSADEIKRVTQGSDAPQWSELDQAIIRAVKEFVADRAIATATWTILAMRWSDPK
jgi:beta-N-acetylglucosaminidase